MSLPGVKSINLETAFAADDVLVNYRGGARRMPVANLSAQLQATTSPTYGLRSELYGDLGWPDAATAKVVGDPTTAYRGIYKKSGAVGSGGWTKIGPLPEADTAELMATLSTITPIMAGVFDDMRPSQILLNGALALGPWNVADTVTDSRVRGVTVPAGSTGADTVLVNSIPIDTATAADLAGRQLRLIAGFGTSTPFTRALVPTIEAVANDGTISPVIIVIITTVGDNGRPVFTVDFTMPSGVAALLFKVRLGTGTAAANFENISQTDLSLAVQTTTADARNRASENSDGSRRLTVLSATEDMGSILDELIVSGQMANGALYRMAPDGVTIVGWTLPIGATGQGSLVQTVYGLSDKQSVLLGGATIEWTYLLEHSAGYNRVMQVTIGVDGALVQSMMTRRQRIDDTHTVLTVRAVMPAAPKFLAPYFSLTGATTAGVVEWVQLSDVSVRIVRSMDRARSAASSSSHVANLRNKEMAMTAIENAARPDEIRQADILVDVPAAATIAPLITAYPQGTRSRRRQFRLASSTFAQGGIFPKSYDSLIGRGRGRTVIDGSLPASTSLAAIEATSTIESYYDADYSDMTVIARNMRYAMHSDLAAGFERPDVVQRLRGMTLVHFGNDDAIAYQTSVGGNPGGVWSNPAAWGCGSWSGWDLSADDCTFNAPTAAVIFHNNVNLARPARMSLRRSRLTATNADGYALRVYNLGATKTAPVELVGNVLAGDIQLLTYAWFQGTLDYQPANHNEHRIFGHGNTPAVFTVTDFGRALKIESAATSGTSTIVVSGSAVAALFGRVTSRPGSGGIKGYVYGEYDVSGTPVGPNSNLQITSLGKRLGDCTSVNKVLTVQINGGASVSIVFNADYTNTGNNTILTMINNALTPGAFSSLYAIGERYRPSITDEEKSLKNVGTDGILMGMACAYVSDGSRSIRRMTSADPVTVFAGVAWEDIYPGAAGRVKTGGYLPIGDLLRTDATALVLGTGLSIDPAQPGRWKTDNSNVIIKAIRPNAVAIVDGLSVVPVSGSLSQGPAGTPGVGVPTTGMATGRLLRWGATAAEWADAVQVRLDLGLDPANMTLTGGSINGMPLGASNQATGRVTTLQTNGNVGVGRAPPSGFAGYSVLGLDGTTGTYLAQYVAGTEVARLQADTTVALNSMGARPIVLMVNNAEALRVDTAGNLCMGAAADVVITAARHNKLRSYTVATRPSASPAGQEIYLSDLGGGGGSVISDGALWKRLVEGYGSKDADIDATLTVLTDAVNLKYINTMTAGRTITLSNANAYDGARFVICRTATGAFNLNVGGLKNLAVNQWCEVVYRAASTDWYVSKFGSL